MNSMTAFLARRFVKSTKYFGLINLVLDRLAVPEVFQEQADPPHLVRELSKLIDSASERVRIATELRPAKERLGQRGATERVARALAGYWGE